MLTKFVGLIGCFESLVGCFESMVGCFESTACKDSCLIFLCFFPVLGRPDLLLAFQPDRPACKVNGLP